jgi:molybdopterin molybdotransferase
MLLSLEKALAAALDSTRVADPVRLPLSKAHGRYLAESVRASRPLPACNNSAMDGYALRSADTKGATRDRPARFTVVESIFAGMLPKRTIEPGRAARIFTGAPIPEGADSVVRQEAARLDGTELEVFVEEEPGRNIRVRGEEVGEGQTVLNAGQQLEAYALAVLASLGHATAWVWPSPRIGILTTGDELISPGDPALPHQSYDSNGILLASLCAQAGATVVKVERAPDRDEALRPALERLMAEADLVVTTGGASVGERDRVKRTITTLGAQLVIDGVALKPGKPVGLARLNDQLVAVLPGNPGAAAVAFDQLVRPILLKRQGVLEKRRRLSVRLGSARRKQPGLTYFLSATVLHEEGGEPIARIRPQGGGQILQNVAAEGWVILPQGRADFAAGEQVAMEFFQGSTFVAFSSHRDPLPEGEGRSPDEAH